MLSPMLLLMLLMEHNPTDNHARSTIRRAAWTANDAAFEAFKTVVAIHIWMEWELAATYLLRPMWCYYETPGKHAMVWYKMSFNSPLVSSVKKVFVFSFDLTLTLPCICLYLSINFCIWVYPASFLFTRVVCWALACICIFAFVFVFLYLYLYHSFVS